MQSDSSPVISSVLVIIYLLVLLLMLVSLWKIYTKAGKPGWASLIPGYNIIVLMEIIGRPTWWAVLYLVPFANLVVSIINTLDLAKVFGKSSAFGIVALGIFPIVGYLMLAFGKDSYIGPGGVGIASSQVQPPVPPVVPTQPVAPLPIPPPQTPTA